MKKLIQRLTDTFSPSGREGAIRDVIYAEVGKHAEEVRVDALGNLIARKGPVVKGARGKPAPEARRIMVAAHMDEIGLIASHIDENGFVRFAVVGGVRPQHLTGGRVRFINGTPGVIGRELSDKGDEPLSTEKMFIDVGATSRRDCPVRVGDVAAFERPFLEMGDRLVSKSMDDRIGCAVAITVLQSIKSTPHEIYFVFTTQEEVGTRGAGTAAFGLDPDIGVAVDVTPAEDTPPNIRTGVGLGKGPAIKIQDSGMIADPRVVAWMERIAKKNKIPYQREVLVRGTTDARAIQIARAGVPSGCLSIPCRYVHSPSETVDYRDVQGGVALLEALLGAPVDL
jgi:putative aminopeptidase FrvX